MKGQACDNFLATSSDRNICHICREPRHLHRARARAEDKPTTPVHTEPQEGCELCNDFPARLFSKCHTTAPLRAVMTNPTTLELRCFIPECDRLVATLRVIDKQIADRIIELAPILIEGLER